MCTNPGCINGEIVELSTDQWRQCPVCAVATRDRDRDMRTEMDAIAYSVHAVGLMGKSAPRGDKRARLLEMLADAYKAGTARRPSSGQ